jgi:SNF family Na+-dependent transporter
MLQNLEDPSAIHPALAVAVLTLLYGLLLAAFVFEPLACFHRAQASQAEPAAEGGHGLLFSVLGLMALSVGGSFMALISAFRGYTP